MAYHGPVDIDSLVDLDALAVTGDCHWTFFAFPRSMLNEHGLPDDLDAQRYIAAIQSTGVPIGIWQNSPVDNTVYVAVTVENKSRLNDAIAELTQFTGSYASELCDKLFRASTKTSDDPIRDHGTPGTSANTESGGAGDPAQ